MSNWNANPYISFYLTLYNEAFSNKPLLFGWIIRHTLVIKKLEIKDCAEIDFIEINSN